MAMNKVPRTGSYRRLIDERSAAELLGISVQTLRNDRARAGRRRFPFVKLGKTIRYDLCDLNQIIDQSRVGAAGERECSHDVAQNVILNCCGEMGNV